MEQEKKTVNWLLSELEGLDFQEAELSLELNRVISQFERYNKALVALTGKSFREHTNEELDDALEPKVQVYYDGELYHRYTGPGFGEETWTQSQWDEYKQNLHH
jgi:hypothetical protein